MLVIRITSVSRATLAVSVHREPDEGLLAVGRLGRAVLLALGPAVGQEVVDADDIPRPLHIMCSSM